MLYLTFSMIPSVDLAHYGVSCAIDLVLKRRKVVYHLKLFLLPSAPDIIRR